MAERKPVQGMSGFCRHSGHHHLCHARWETPSALVTCSCTCHARRMVPKGDQAMQSVARVIVPKK